MLFWKALFWVNVISMVIGGILSMAPGGGDLPSSNVLQVVAALISLYELTVNKEP